MATKRRCAIYTRKSSEEGLEQDFNSLQAQREACESYIRSQRGEGWEFIKTRYDDGGFSGGNMERPALLRLLEDIKARQVDIVVVYKVDRLTRSLADFAKMVEVFDAQGVSFVAVTQQFNTTTSMGRLTLNVLLSFAQFEREVTGERIRDKIAASKRKGMWMGGSVPIGYDAKGRTLVINPAEAEIVRHIYKRYADSGSVRRVKLELDQAGIVTKARIAQSGNRFGGLPFQQSGIYHVLNNPIYIGCIRHKGTIHPGQHEPIVDRTLWDEVQARLTGNGGNTIKKAKTRQAYPLVGKLFDAKGEALVPTSTTNHDRKYRYYVSPVLTIRAADEATTWRLPAGEIERAVAEATITMLSDQSAIAGALREAKVDARNIPAALERAASSLERLTSDPQMDTALGEIVDRVVVKEESLTVTLTLAAILPTAEQRPEVPTPAIVRTFTAKFARRGVETRLVIQSGRNPPAKVDPALLKAVARGWCWFEDLMTGAATTFNEIAAREGVTDRYVGRLLSLAFLAPEMVEAVAAGTQAPMMTAARASKAYEFPVDWQEQSRLFNP